MITATVPQPAGAPPKELNVAKRTDSLYYIMQSIEVTTIASVVCVPKQMLPMCCRDAV